MATVDETKSRLLRGVVEDNLEVRQRVKLRRPKLRRFSVRSWLVVGLIASAFGYLVLPSFVVSNGPGTNATHTDSMIGVAAALNFEPTPEAAVAPSHPPPLDPAAVPPSV